MPGPVSDSYDAEFGTGENASEIRDSLKAVYDVMTGVLSNEPPMYIIDLVRAYLPRKIHPCLTEKQCRLIRFALKRAMDSI